MAAVHFHTPDQFWSQLSQDDKDDYVKICSNFRQNHKAAGRHHRAIIFQHELLVLLGYIERRPDNMDVRAMLVGVCFAGPIICVNTHLLKSILSRCKSTINGSFQQLGFAALRAKGKARACVLAVLPSLTIDRFVLRQWTARYVSEHARFCFVSVFPYDSLPFVSPDELINQPPSEEEPEEGILEGDLEPRPDSAPGETKSGGTTKGSLSVSDSKSVEVEFIDPNGGSSVGPPMRESGSVRVRPLGRTWNLFDDGDEDTVF
jgi:hypothetical protein